MEQNSKTKEVIFTVNEDIQPLNPQKIQKKCSEEESLKARYKEIQAWKSDCPNSLLNFTNGNGLVNTVYKAYSEHYNLELSPDDIWLAILQGFSNHLENNHERLKKQFVDFEGKKELWIQRDQFTWGSNNNDWAGCFSEWCEQIQENIGKQNYENLILKFTTETQISLACQNATVMDSMKHYFSFGVRTHCGIPKVKLTGTLEDWQKLKEKAQNLGQYDLEWWTSILIPILDKFIESYQGKVDQVFWNSIYKVVPVGRGSGAVTTVTGWIINFFPYIQGKRKNSFLTPLEKIYENYKQIELGKKIQVHDDLFYYEYQKGIMEKKFIMGGITETPFKWDYHGEKKDMKIIAGFHNVCYQNGFIKPAKGWAITEKIQEQEDKKEKILPLIPLKF